MFSRSSLGSAAAAHTARRTCTFQIASPVARISAKRSKFSKPDIHVYLRDEVPGIGSKGEIAMVNLAQARNYLVPFGLAYYVPRIRGKPILPEGWEPRIREDDVILETITPAFSTVKIEPRNTESTASPQAAAAGLASRERRIERDADKLTRLSSLPQLIFDRVRMRTDSPRIYGSVTPEDILAELHETHGLVLEKDAVKLDARIKDLGEHVVAVEVGTGNVKITIVVKDLGAENVTAGNANDATPPTPLA